MVTMFDVDCKICQNIILYESYKNHIPNSCHVLVDMKVIDQTNTAISSSVGQCRCSHVCSCLDCNTYQPL